GSKPAAGFLQNECRRALIIVAACARRRASKVPPRWLYYCAGESVRAAVTKRLLTTTRQA
ncbi:MAG: hypothetical protein M3417_07380, partial [Actinomycetota bacterium]|nr:hypothetical protein [Actinomycetota bacterium]